MCFVFTGELDPLPCLHHVAKFPGSAVAACRLCLKILQRSTHQEDPKPLKTCFWNLNPGFGGMIYPLFSHGFLVPLLPKTGSFKNINRLRSRFGVCPSTRKAPTLSLACGPRPFELAKGQIFQTIDQLVVSKTEWF